MSPILESVESFQYIIDNTIEITLSSLSFAQKCNIYAKSKNKKISVHLFFDLGMGREGFLYRDYKKVLDECKNLSGINIKGVMIHFPVADSANDMHVKYTEKMIKKFYEIQQYYYSLFGATDIIFHSANSGSTTRYSESFFDMIRPGIAIYGYPEYDNNFGLKPVMQFSSRVNLIKKYPKSHSIGYGCTYKTQTENEYIALVPIGYGDGLLRSLGGRFSVYIKGKQYKNIGRISMDQCTFLVDEKIEEGDEVVFIGGTSWEDNNAESLANIADTISYEILCSLGNSSRAQHKYLYE